MQLIYDYDFNNIIEDIKLEDIKPWNEIPNYIISDIKNTKDNLYLYDFIEDKNYCSKCLKELDDYYCNNCNIKYDINNNIFIDSIDEYSFNYCVFDITDKIILYKLEVTLLNNEFNIKTKSIYIVENNGLNDILNNKFYSYDKFNEYDDFNTEEVYLYIDNLYKLKNNELYKYSNIWELKDYFNHFINIKSITYYPVYLKQFEYLVKMKLYNLAIDGSELIDSGKTFKQRFKVDKKYYNFMKDINITSSELLSLQFYNTTDIELLRFINNNKYYLEDIINYINIKELKKYCDKLDMKYLYEYSDYIKWCIKLGLDLNNKKILYPNNFIEAHDKLEKEIIIKNDSNIDKSIKKLSNILSLNTYEIGKYIIFPAKDIDDLIDESRQMHNCVRTYYEKYGNNESQIYFIRYKNSINESLVTIEVVNGKVVQARCKYNKDINAEMENTIKIWEKSLIKVENEC